MNHPPRYLVDTNVFLYARGAEHAYREPCRRILAGIGGGDLRLVASVEVVQEYLYVRLRRGEPRGAVLDEALAIRRQCAMQPFDGAVLTLAVALLRRHSGLAARACVHAATALIHDVPRILSADRAFDVVDGLERVDPIALAAELGPDG